MEDINKFSFQGVFQKIKEYLENYADLAYLKFVKRSAKILPGVAIGVVILLFAFFVVFYLSMALAFFFGELLNSYAAGFALTGAIFIFFILLVALFKKAVKTLIANFFVRILIKLRNDDDDDEA